MSKISEHQSNGTGDQSHSRSSEDNHLQPVKEASKTEQEIMDNPLPSDGVAGDRLEQPSWKPHPVKAQFPDDLRAIRLTEPETYAAGVPAVIRSLEHLAINKSISRGTRSLLSLNHSHGIDCMSCAWPESDSHRKIAEFCENGAKAVAWETDSRKCGAEFFAEHSIVELSNKDEYWLGQQGRLTEPMVLREGTDHLRADFMERGLRTDCR